MPRRRISTADPTAGNDSFLDIVANMVGIMIILVMVVGVQAKDAFLAQSPAAQAEPPASESATDTQSSEDAATRQRLVDLQAEVQELATRTSEVQQEAKTRFQLRNQLQTLAVAGEQHIQQQRAALDQSKQEQFDLQRQLQTAHDELEDLSTARLTVENSAAPVVVLKHLPTPMAKTVFGKEEHFRLLNGYLVYVPLNTLVQEMQQQAEMKIYKLKESPSINEIIGPIGGFTMKYSLGRRRVSVNTPQGSAVREIADLTGFVLVPNSTEMGEPIDIALQEGSDFLTRLRSFDPNATTITIWTYPNSFGNFRRVKDHLYELGYLTAGRPMPEGHPIGGSPRGTRSGAQ